MSALSTSFRQFVLPKEHGSWSLALEPIALGLLIAPSAPGAAFAFAIAAAFFVRRPLKVAWNASVHDPRRAIAANWTTIFSVLALVGLSASAVGSGALTGTGETWPALWPVLLAVPFGATFLWFDLRNEMREAEAELAGSATFAVLPAAFATLAGWDALPALALGAVMLARSIPTVLTVRAYLRLRKNQQAHRGAALVASLFAVVVIAALQFRGALPPLLLALPALLLVRTLFLLGPWRPTWSGKRVGILEAVIGLVYLGAATTLFWLR